MEKILKGDKNAQDKINANFDEVYVEDSGWVEFEANSGVSVGNSNNCRYRKVGTRVDLEIDVIPQSQVGTNKPIANLPDVIKPAKGFGFNVNGQSLTQFGVGFLQATGELCVWNMFNISGTSVSTVSVPYGGRVYIRLTYTTD